MNNFRLFRRIFPSVVYILLLLLLFPDGIVPERDEFMEPVDGDYALPTASPSVVTNRHNNNNKPLPPTNIPLSTAVDQVIISADTDIPDIDVYKEQIMRRIHSSTNGNGNVPLASSSTVSLATNENNGNEVHAPSAEDDPSLTPTALSSSSASSAGTASVNTGGTVVSSTNAAASVSTTNHVPPSTPTASMNTNAPSTLPTGTAIPPTLHPTTSFIPEIEIDKDSPVVETVSDNEVDPLKQHRTNFAADAAGAVIMGSNPEMKGVHHLLAAEGDSYALSPCEVKKWAIIGLSEDVLVDTIVISNEEKYSSSVQNFRVVGSQKYPATEWVVLGNFTAENRLGEQMFPVPVRSWVRYLKFSWLSHYGNEFYCTWTRIRVHGSTILEDLQVHMLNSEAQVSIAKAQIERQNNVAVAGGNVQIVPSTNNPVTSTTLSSTSTLGTTANEGGNNENSVAPEHTNENMVSEPENNQANGSTQNVTDEIIVNATIESKNEEQESTIDPNTPRSDEFTITETVSVDNTHRSVPAVNITDEIAINIESSLRENTPEITNYTVDVTVTNPVLDTIPSVSNGTENVLPTEGNETLTIPSDPVSSNTTMDGVGTVITNTTVNIPHKFSESALAAVAEMLSYLNITLSADKLDSVDEVDQEMLALQCLADELLLLQQQHSQGSETNHSDGSSSSFLSASSLGNGTIPRNLTVRPECIGTLDSATSSLLLASNISDNLHTILLKDMVEQYYRHNQTNDSLPSPSILPSTLPIASSSPLHTNKDASLTNGDPYATMEADVTNVNSLGILSRKTSNSFNAPLSRSNPATANVFKALSMRLSDLEIDASVIHSYLSDMHTRYSGALSSMAKQVETLRSHIQNVRNMSFGVQYSTTVDNLVDTLNLVQQHIDNVDQRQLIIEKLLIKFLIYLRIPLPTDIIEDIQSLQPDTNDTHWIELIESNTDSNHEKDANGTLRNKFLPSPWMDDHGTGSTSPSTDGKDENNSTEITVTNGDDSKSLSLINGTIVSNETILSIDTLASSFGIPNSDELLTVIEPLLRTLENTTTIGSTINTSSLLTAELMTTAAVGPIPTIVPSNDAKDTDKPSTGWMGSLYRIYVFFFVRPMSGSNEETTSTTTTTATSSSSSAINETLLTDTLQSIHRLEQELVYSRLLTMVALMIAFFAIATVVFTFTYVWKIHAHLQRIVPSSSKDMNTVTETNDSVLIGKRRTDTLVIDPRPETPAVDRTTIIQRGSNENTSHVPVVTSASLPSNPVIGNVTLPALNAQE